MNKFLKILTVCFITLTVSTITFSQRTKKDIDKDLFLEGELGNTKKFVSIRKSLVIYTKYIEDYYFSSGLPHRSEKNPRRAIPLEKCTEHRIELHARFMYKENQRNVNPKFVEINLKSQRPYASYFGKENTRRLKITADKQEHDFGIMERTKNKVRSTNPIGGCPIHREVLVVKIPVDTYAEIVASKKVKLKFGKFRIRIDRERYYSGLQKLALELQK